jgi:hypothetical protein
VGVVVGNSLIHIETVDYGVLCALQRDVAQTLELNVTVSRPLLPVALGVRPKIERMDDCEALVAGQPKFLAQLAELE